MTATLLHLADGTAFPFPHHRDLTLDQARDRIADLIAISSRALITRSIVDGVHSSPSE